jgi:cell division ATPase FtsA
LENVCQNINQAIEKAQNDAKIKIQDFMINVISPNLFFESSRINYTRDNENPIDEKEAYEILKTLETQAFRNHYKRIKNST